MTINNIKFENDIVKKNFEEYYSKNSSKLKRIINLLGIIDNNLKKIEISIYEYNKDANSYKYYCSNMEDKIVLFSLSNEDNSNNDIVEVYSNDGTISYNLSILPKLKLDSDNICLIENGSILNTRYGRIVTDFNKFYNILLGQGNSYRIESKSTNSEFISKELIKLINLSDDRPKINTILSFLNEIVLNNNIDFELESIKSFENGNIKDNIIIQKTQKKVKRR